MAEKFQNGELQEDVRQKLNRNAEESDNIKGDVTVIKQQYIKNGVNGTAPETADGIKNTSPGPLDKNRGPYVSVAAANLAIANSVVNGRNLREGKFVEIGTSPNLVTFWWNGGYANENLVEYFGELASKETERVVNNILSPVDIDISLPYKTPNGYYRLTDGAYIISENWKTSQRINVNPNDLIKRIGSPFVVGGSVATPIAFFNKLNVYLGGMPSITEVSTIQVKDLYPDTSYVFASSNNNTPSFQVFRTITIPEKNIDGLAAIKANQNSQFNPRSNNKAGILRNGYYNKSTGIYVSNTGYVSTEKLNVNPSDLLIRKGNAYNNSSSVTSPFLFWDGSDNFLGSFSGTVATDFSVVVKDLYPTATKIAFTSTSNIGLEAYINSIIDQLAVNGLPKIALDVKSNLNNISRLIDPSFDWSFSDLLNTGYINASGSVVTAGAENWRYTKRIPVISGDIVLYKGKTQGLARSLVGYKDNGSVVILLGAIDSLLNYTSVLITEGITSVIASHLMTSGNFSTIAAKVKADTADIIITPPEFFMPKKAYARAGEELRINPFGIIAKHPLDRSIDLIWSEQLGNELHFSYTPGPELTKQVSLKYRDSKGDIKTIGTTEILVTHTFASPSVAQNFLAIGDSTLKGVASSNIEGAPINELSRRLTGLGTALLSGVESPAPLNLTNLYFRGTIGDQPIKHEGRGGWGIQNYLQNDQVSGTTNAFWNPTTSSFDLAYYLTNNGFNANQTAGGVDSNGNNLTVTIHLGWNHVYNHTVLQASDWMKQLIDKIHIQKPGAKVKLIGLQNPAYPNRKDFTGTRNISVESIMREAVVQYSKAWQSITELPAYNSFVEFIPIAPFFFPIKSYPSQMIKTAPRNSDLIEVYDDYVHLNGRGYSQIADAMYYNILYNNCKTS